MSEARAARTGRAGEQGFLLILMLGVVAIGGIGILFAVQSFAPPLSDVVIRAEQNLAVVGSATRTAFRGNGAFPNQLNGLASVTSGLTSTPWRADPWGAAQDLDYAVLATGVRVRSRGVDRTLATADDTQVDVAAETLVRVRQRCKLRLIRAVVTRSQYRYAATMSAAEVASLRSSMRNYATARRQWLTASAATRVTLTTTMNTAADTLTALATAHACPAMPASVTGVGGLMQQLAMPDGKAVDGIAATLLGDASVGVLARGYDATGRNR